jgi:hypothetical protein
MSHLLAIGVGTLLGACIFWTGYCVGWRDAKRKYQVKPPDHYEGRDAI